MKLQICNYNILILIVLLNLANITDLLTTLIALKSHYFVELNPILVFLAKIFPPFIIIFKIGIVLSISFLLIYLYDIYKNSKLSRAIFTGVFWGSFLSCVVLWLISFHNVLLLIAYT